MDKVAITVILFSSAVVFYACVCRLKLTHKGVYARVRNRYVLLGVGALCAILGPFIFKEEGGGLYGVAIFFVSVAASFLLDQQDWSHGVPDSATIPGELDEGK